MMMENRTRKKDANARDSGELSHPSAVESHRSSLGSKTSLWSKPFGTLSSTTTSGAFVDKARMTSRMVRELPSPLAPEAMAMASSQVPRCVGSRSSRDRSGMHKPSRSKVKEVLLGAGGCKVEGSRLGRSKHHCDTGKDITGRTA